MKNRKFINETHDENVFAMADAVANALGHESALENMYKGMGKDEGVENMEYIARHYEVEIPDMRTDSGMEGYWGAFDQLKTAMGDEAFFDNTIQAMETQTATELFDFIMRNYEISMGDDEVEDFDPSKHWEGKVREAYDVPGAESIRAKIEAAKASGDGALVAKLEKELQQLEDHWLQAEVRQLKEMPRYGEEYADMDDDDDVNQEVILKSKMQCAYAGMELQGQISDEESAAFFREMADIAEQGGDFGAIVDDLRAAISGKPKPAPTKMKNHWAESKDLGDRIAESLSKKLKEYGWDDDDDDEFGGEDLSQYEKEFPDAFNAGGDRDDDAEAAAAKDAEIDDLMSKYGMNDGEPEEEEDPTVMREEGAGVSAEQFADEHGLDLQTDNDGQKIIYVDADQAFSLSMRETDAIIKAAGWDVQRTDDGFVIYTGEYAGGGAIDRGHMEEPDDGFGSPAHYQEDTGYGHSQLRHSRLNETLMKWAIK